MVKKGSILLMCIIALMAFAIWAPNAAAFDQWSVDKDSGNCADCHSNFRTSPYISLADGYSWGDDLHDVHRNTMLSGDCDACHSAGPRFPVLLASSDGGTGFDPISCVGCHGRDGDLNNGQIGAGLRQHHTNADAAFCGDCHQDNDPATFIPVGESAAPSYYFTPDAAHPNKPTDPCNPAGEEDYAGSAIGLDNDGDLPYDGDDPDCAANTPPVADPNGPYTGVVNMAVMFDGTDSNDPDGTIVSYDWDFGDGNTGTGPQPQHTYDTAGVYDVSLTVMDDAGDTSDPVATTATIDPANQAPTADPNGPYSGTVGVPVTFDGSGSNDPDGSIDAYDWDFGDGNTDTGVSPTHTYATDGVFTVSLTVTDDAGATDSATTTATIGLGNQPPVADPNGPYTGTVGVPVAFDGTGSNDPDGSIDAYDWDFGDGTVILDAGPTPTHTYATAGLYNVTLTVTDDAGTIDSAMTTATINPPAVVDLDIAQFQVTKRIRLSAKNPKPVSIKLVVENGGEVNVQTRPATVIGMQNGVEVYNEILQISDPVGNGRTTFKFPTFTPVDAGNIMWTATIADDDPDVDEAIATTTVVD
jgi:PKD repeat protein